MRTKILSLEKGWPYRSQQPDWVLTLFNWLPKEVWGIDGWHDVYVCSFNALLSRAHGLLGSWLFFSFLLRYSIFSFSLFLFSACWTLHLVAFWAFGRGFQILQACDIYPDYFPIVSDTSICYLNDESICLFGIYFCLFPIFFSISGSNNLMVPCTTSIYLLRWTSIWKTASSSPVLLYQDFIYHIVNRIMTAGSISFLQLLSATFLYEEDLTKIYVCTP